MDGMNTILYFWRREKNQEVFMVFRVFGERNMVTNERKKNAQKDAQTAPKTSPLVGAPGRAWLTSAISSSCIFSVLTSDRH